MTVLLAIDPGPEFSAWVLYDTSSGTPIRWDKEPSRPLCDLLVGGWMPRTHPDELAIEMIASYGMPVGAEVFSTCVITGRIWQSWRSKTGRDPLEVYRRDVKLHLCGQARAKDPNVRQALIDRFGPGKDRAIGKKASPGPLHGMTGDCWAALGVAVTAADTMLHDRRAAA